MNPSSPRSSNGLLNLGIPRRLKRSTLARRCIGSMIILAGASIITSDMIAFATSGNTASAPSLMAAGNLRAIK